MHPIACFKATFDLYFGFVLISACISSGILYKSNIGHISYATSIDLYDGA